MGSIKPRPISGTQKQRSKVKHLFWAICVTKGDLKEIEKQLKEIEGAGETWVLLRGQLHPRCLWLKAHCAVFTLDN